MAVTSADVGDEEEARRGDPVDALSDLSDDFGAHRGPTRWPDGEVEHTRDAGFRAPVETVVVADGPPWLNETAATVLAVIVRGWVETVRDRGGHEQDSAA